VPVFLDETEIAQHKKKCSTRAYSKRWHQAIVWYEHFRPPSHLLRKYFGGSEWFLGDN
jgi:hypothetical protein